MDPQKFLQEYLFYTPEKIKEINEAQRQSAASNPAAPASKPKSESGPTYKQVRKDGRYITIDARTGEEVGAFEGRLKPVGDFVKNLARDTVTTAKIGLSDLKNLPSDITPHLIYSDTAVDKNGRPLTKAQAGEHSYNRDERVQKIMASAPNAENSAATPKAPESTNSGMINRTSVEPINGSFSAAVREREQESATPRQETVRNGAKGTQMTFEKMNEGLSAGITVRNPFASFTKPGDYSAEDAIAMGASPDEAATKAAGGFVEVDLDAPGGIETKMVQGSPNLVMSGAALSGEKTNNPKDPSTWDENYARRRAFLDADDSMQGLRNVQAQKGIVYAGGQYYRANENAGQEGESDFVAIDQKNRGDVKAYMRGDRDAQSFLGNKLADMKNISESSSLVEESQGGFQMMDEKNRIIGPNLTDMPAVTQKDSTGRFNVFYENRNPPSQR